MEGNADAGGFAEHRARRRHRLFFTCSTERRRSTARRVRSASERELTLLVPLQLYTVDERPHLAQCEALDQAGKFGQWDGEVGEEGVYPGVKEAATRVLETERPLSQVIPAGLGFWLTRAGLFPVPASRGASVLILNVFLPNLLFSKIVPSITPENAKAIGPIFLVGFVYIIISLLLGVLVRVTFRTPRNFRWGILAAATWSKCVSARNAF